MTQDLNPRSTAQGPLIARVERTADGQEIAWDPQGYRVYGYSTDPALEPVWHENSRQAALFHNQNVKRGWRSYRWQVGAALLGSAVWICGVLQGGHHPAWAILVPLLGLGGQTLFFSVEWGFPERVSAPWGQAYQDSPRFEAAVTAGLHVLLRVWLLTLGVGFIVVFLWALLGLWVLFSR